MDCISINVSDELCADLRPARSSSCRKYSALVLARLKDDKTDLYCFAALLYRRLPQQSPSADVDSKLSRSDASGRQSTVFVRIGCLPSKEMASSWQLDSVFHWCCNCTRFAGHLSPHRSNNHDRCWLFLRRPGVRGSQ